MSNNATIIATVAGVAACSALLLSPLLFKKSAAASESNAIKDIDDIDDIDGNDNADKSSPDGDYITEEDVVKVFDTLFLQMQSVLAQLSTQLQQLQMSGQMIPEQQIRQILKSEFERALLAKQKGIFEENNIDEVCLEEATWEFMREGEKYPKAKKAVERFQKLYENVSGESVVGRLPGDNDESKSKEALTVTSDILPKDKLQTVAKIYFDSLTETMRTLVNKFKEQGASLTDHMTQKQLQVQFAMLANDVGEEALQTQNVTLDGFRKSIEAHQSDPEVGRTLAFLQMKQQQELMAMGVAPM